MESKRRSSPVNESGVQYKLLAVIMAGIFLWAVPSVCVRAAEARVIDTVTYDGSIYIYVRGITQVQEGSSVQIGNTACTEGQVSATSFSDMDLSVRTLVLVDNSKSVSEQGQSDIREILEGLISVLADNEQMKIGTFSDKAAYLCDFTGDKDILNNVVNVISYNDQDSYLSDVLYDEIIALKEKEANSCTRLLVLSDGADDNAVGYTNDEVRSYIGGNTCQVYTVGIAGKNNSGELEELFSFSRAAKSDYFLMDGSITGEDVVNTLRQDQEGVCLKIVPDESLKDGSSKNILLQLNTPEGNIALTTSADMPFGTGFLPGSPQQEGAEEPTPAVEEEESIGETGTESSAEDPLPALAASPNTEIENGRTDSSPLIYITGGAVFLILLLTAVAVVFYSQRKKKGGDPSGKKSKEDPPKTDPKSSKEPEEGGGDGAGVQDVTVRRPDCGQEENGDTGHTQRVWFRTPGYYLVLRCLDMPNIMYKVPLAKCVRIVGKEGTQEISVRIGRRAETSDIVLNDNEVSRSHCEIILRDGQLYLKDNNSTENHNPTKYENVIVYGETPVESGGKLKIGAHVYCVELKEES